MRIRRWSHKPSHSRSVRDQEIVFQVKFFPVFKYWKTVNLNTAVSTIPSRIGRTSIVLYLIREENRSISAIAFGRGGRPSFPHTRTSQTIGKREKEYFSPRLILRVRVFFRS